MIANRLFETLPTALSEAATRMQVVDSNSQMLVVLQQG